MTVILFLLKLIGIILLVLLGIILTLLVLLLFVPVRYQIKGFILGETTIELRLYWLLHLLVFSLSYEEKKLTTEFRILGFRLFPREKKKSALDDTDFDDLEEAEDERVTQEPVQEIPQLTATEYSGEPQTDSPEKPQTESQTDEGGEPQTESQTKESREPQTDSPEAHRRQKRQPKRKIAAFIDKWKRFWEKIKQIPDKVSAIWSVISDEGNHKVVSFVWEQIRYLLRHSKFRKLKTDLTFSAGDPALTGQILGVLCMIPVLYQYEVSMMPDFESEQWYLRGTFEIKGHARLVHVLRSGILLWKEKEVRRFVNRMMKK